MLALDWILGQKLQSSANSFTHGDDTDRELFFALNQVAITMMPRDHPAKKRLVWPALTLRRAHKEARHAQAAGETLCEPYQTIIAFVVPALSINYAQEERPQRDQDCTSDEKFSNMASI
jgi:hypothetical protein